ncbi:MAG: hypothetical protein J6C05_05970 [Prevotella sp.]|nr:hypothetical protein [Prevotella sp.]
MNIILFASILIILLTLYYLTKKSNAEKEFIQCVEAGPTREVDANELRRRSYYDRKAVIRGLNGEELSHERYARLLVKGYCMTERGINNGDIIVAEKVGQEQMAAIEQRLQPNNIVWLHIDDTEMDKIRIFKEWKDGEMITYYYVNGQERLSSSPHNINQIRGVVQFKVS